MVLHARAFLLACVTPVLACSSSDFAVGALNADAQSDDTATVDGLPVDDTSTDPCRDEPGVAKFCVDIELAQKEHPPYDGSSGSSALGIDGKGVVYVALFDKDPSGTIADRAVQVAPKAVLRYPPAERVGETADIDTDLPRTMVGSAPPGEYWVITAFQDSEAPRDGRPVLPGDFVVVPGATSDGKTLYPKMTLVEGKAVSITQKLRPLRRVDVNLGVAPGLAAEAKANASIKGSGPVLFALYDGEWGAKPTVLSAEFVPCQDFTLQGAVVPRKRLSFTTTVDGSHNLIAALFDYGPTSEAGNEFPYRGTLITETNSNAPVPGSVPKLAISTTSWTSDASFVDLVGVHLPYTVSPPNDPLTCK
jgi:hypothetical protein